MVLNGYIYAVPKSKNHCGANDRSVTVIVVRNVINNVCLGILIIVYYVIKSKNEILCAAAGRLAAERSEADKAAKAHKTIFALHNIYYFFFKPS
jgi:hypothetical protein